MIIWPQPCDWHIGYTHHSNTALNLSYMSKRGAIEKWLAIFHQRYRRDVKYPNKFWVLFLRILIRNFRKILALLIPKNYNVTLKASIESKNVEHFICKLINFCPDVIPLKIAYKPKIAKSVKACSKRNNWSFLLWLVSLFDDKLSR